MFLIIDTADNGKLKIILASGNDDFKIIERKTGARDTDKLLAEIDGALKKNRTSVKKIKGVAAIIGPGGFTNLRIGVAVANALAYGLDVPTAGFVRNDFKDDTELVVKTVKFFSKKKKFRPLIPEYGREPNIG